MLDSCHQNAISDRAALCPSSSRLSVRVPIPVLPLVPAVGCCKGKACVPISVVIPPSPSAECEEEKL